MRKIKLMADYNCWPLWESGDRIGNVDPGELPISDGLKQRLIVWARQFDQTLDRQSPVSSGFPDAGSLNTFEAEGQRLWQDLRIQLGEGYEVAYFSEKRRQLLQKPEKESAV